MFRKGQTGLLVILLITPALLLPNNDNSVFSTTPNQNDSAPFNGSPMPGNDALQMDSGGYPVPSSPQFYPSESTGSGTLNPVVVEQRGYYSSGNISARTDTSANTGTNLLLDTDHNWVADQAEASVWNLEKLYAVNGSFDEGYAGTNVYPNGSVQYYPLGWDANSTDTATYSDDVQLASYDSTGRQYVTVESQGGKVGQNAFGHDAGTKVVWTQNVTNIPYTENFLLSFDYFYLRGPIDGPTGTDPVTGNCSITVFINNQTVWNMSLLLLSQRGVWFSSGQIPLTVVGAPSSFTFAIGLVIDESLVLDKRADYDGDPSHLADGIDNAAYISAYLDNISLLKTISPTPGEVNLRFRTSAENVPLSGSSGQYSASIVNASYWTATPVPVEVTANTSVSFDYKARLLSHRFTDSNWRTDISSYGISYTVGLGVSPELTFYSYVGYLGDYEDPQMIVRYPQDWANITVSDPFLVNLTASCTITPGGVVVPSSFLDHLGWWQFRMQSPNYAKSIEIQKYSLSTGWSADTTFRVGNLTRPSIEIGTATEIPPALSNVNITWGLPNGTTWFEEYASGGINGNINGSSKTIDSSLAGRWQIEFLWSNGTEVAFLNGSFAVYHSSTLTPLDTMIETDAGDVVTGRVEFVDAENGRYLMETAIIKGNWSGAALTFSSNPTRRWWEADFDTSIVGAGLFTVEVNATLPYYDTATCQFWVLSTNMTRLTSPNAPWTSAIWEDTAVLTFHYETYDASGSAWVPVSNSSGSVRATANWTLGSWSVSETGVAGIYEMLIYTSAKPAASYLLNISFSKPAHQSRQMAITLLVSPQVSTLTIYNGSSARADIEDNISLKFNYQDASGHDIAGANLVVDTVSPSSGLGISAINPVVGEPGNYSVDIAVLGIGVYTVRFLASMGGYQPATSVFVLVVNDVPTSLTVTSGETAEIGLTDSYLATYHFESYNGTPISGAQLSVIYSGPSGGLSWSPPSDDGSGDYSVQFSSTISGAYLITLAAARQYYQSDSVSFFLSVGEITSHLDILNGTADTVDYGQTYRLVLSYYNGTPIGLDGANVSILSITPSSGLSAGTVVDEGSGYYSVALDPQVDDTFTLLFRANLTNHQTQFATFTLVSNPVPTNLLVMNSTTSLQVDSNFSFYLRYVTEGSLGVEGGHLEIIDPPSTVLFSSFEDLGNGYYRLHAFPTLTGSFQFTVTSSKTFYQTESTSVFLVVGDIPAHLEILNGTAGSVTYGSSFNLVLSFYNDSSYGLAGAALSFASISPSGLPASTFTDHGQGLYSVILEPLKSNTFYLLIKANLTNHEVRFASFTFVVEPVATVLKVMNTSTSISVDRNYNLTFKYEDEYGDGVAGATIESINTPEGVILSDVEDVGQGYYRVNIDPSRIGVFSFLFKASMANHQTASSSYILESTLIPTQLRFSGNIQSGTTTYGEEFDISFFYERTDMSVNITSASVNVTAQHGDFRFLIVSTGNGYVIRVFPFDVGIHALSIMVSKDNHAPVIETFTLTVQEIPTELTWFNSPEEIYFGHEHQFSFSYVFDANQTGISDSNLVIAGSKSSWVSSETLTPGLYNISITPDELGTFTITFTFSGNGLETQRMVLVFTVISVEVEAQLSSSTFATEGSQLTVVVDLVERGTDIPVTAADLRCRLDIPDSLWLTLRESSPGHYVGQLPIPIIETDSDIGILFYFSKTNYQLISAQSYSIHVQTDPLVKMAPALTMGGGSLAFLAIALVGLRVRKTRKQKRNLRAIAVKQRFDDVKNMIGLIVLHKKSGLPIYSKTLKGGFDETMVSAFITAVSHFRSEFGMDEKHWDFQVVPISDIISAVPTRNMICAFITGSSPSREQQVKMEAFARAAGAMFDESVALAPTHELEAHEEELFTSLFMDLMDGELLTAYKMREAARLPRSMSCLSSVVDRMENKEFTLDALARGMAMCGIEEGEAYLQVMDAIDNDIIQPANGYIPTES